MRARLVGFVDAFQHFRHWKVHVVHRPEHRIVQRVEADGHAPESRVLQRPGLLLQQRTVGREREVEAGFLRQQIDQLLELAPYQRLAAGDAHLLDAVAAENPHQPVDLVESEQLRALQELKVPSVHLLGHAVGAAEVAAIRHRNPQIAKSPAAGVGDRTAWPAGDWAGLINGSFMGCLL